MQNWAHSQVGAICGTYHILEAPRSCALPVYSQNEIYMRILFFIIIIIIIIIITVCSHEKQPTLDFCLISFLKKRINDCVRDERYYMYSLHANCASCLRVLGTDPQEACWCFWLYHAPTQIDSLIFNL